MVKVLVRKRARPVVVHEKDAAAVFLFYSRGVQKTTEEGSEGGARTEW